MFLNYLLPFLSTILTFLCLEVSFNFPSIFYWPLVFLILAYLVIIFVLTKAKRKTDRVNFIIFPVLSAFVFASYLTTVSNNFIGHFLIIILTILNYIYWRNIFFFIHYTKKYKVFSLEHFSYYANFLLIFLLASSAYGLRIFINLDIYLASLIVFICLGLIVYQTFWFGKKDFKFFWPYLLVIVIVLLEIFYSLSLLPLTPLNLGLIMSASYYLLINIIIDRFNDKISSKRIILYSIFFIIIVALSLLTAQWN
jgi:hypothetical protein